MLTLADRTLGHKLAGQWLADSGVTDAIVKAQHFALGGENERSVAAYVVGAADALAGGDLDAVIACAKKAYALGASGDDYCSLRLLELEAHHWRADLAVVARVGEEVLGLVTPGSIDHFRAIARVVAAHGRMNAMPRVLELAQMLLALVDHAVIVDYARSAALHAAAEVVNQVLVVGSVEALPGLFELEGRIPDRQSISDPLLMAWRMDLRATRALADRDMQAWVEATEQSTGHFAQAGDHRQRCAELANVGFGYMELGLWSDALRVLRDALEVSESLGQATTKHVVGHHLGFVLGVLGKSDEGAQMLTAALAHAVETQNLQLATSSRTYLALVALERRDLAAALTWAHATLDHATTGTPAIIWAHAVYAAVLIEREMIDEAADAVQTAWTLHETLGASAIPGAIVYRTYAEVCHRVGHKETAHAVIALAYEKIMVAAFKIKRSEWSRSYLENVREHARTLALAKAWGVAG
jgi:tetratricopeptide (TPR) repeat protein